MEDQLNALKNCKKFMEGYFGYVIVFHNGNDWYVVEKDSAVDVKNQTPRRRRLISIMFEGDLVPTPGDASLRVTLQSTSATSGNVSGCLR